MIEYTIDIDKVTSWKDVCKQLELYEGFEFKKYNLPEILDSIKSNSIDETLILIKNPQIGFGMKENKFRTILLEIITVVNTELYASNRIPTIKVAFTR